MKKFTCTILALLLLVTLAACTGRNTSDGTSSANGSTASGTSAASESAAASSGGVEKISVFAWGGDGELAAHEARVALFNEAYAGKIEATLEVVPSQDYTTKLNAMFTAGNAHDVVMEAADYNGFYYRTRNFENLTPFVERDGLALDELLFQGIDNGNVHGDNYREALPFVGNTMVIAYNKDMFDAAGVPYPTDDWTWDEFIDVCKKMTSGEGANKIYAISNHWATTSFAPSMEGGRLFDLEAKPAQMMANDPNTIRGIERMSSLILDGYMPDKQAADTLSSSARFFGQQSAMIYFFNWDSSWFGESIADTFQWGFVRLPKNENGISEGVTWTTGLAMNAASQKKDAAWEFIKFFCLDEECNRITMQAGMPILASMQEEYSKTTISNTETTSDIFIDALATSVINPLGGSFNRIGDEYSRIWEKITLEGADVTEAMNEMQTVCQPILEELTAEK